MKKKIVSMAIVCCLAFQSGAAVVPVLASEPDYDAVEEFASDEEDASAQDETVSEDISEGQPDEIDDAEETVEMNETIEYINGIPADYDDPDCMKKLNAMNESGIQTFAVTTKASSVSTTWDGVTYYHDEEIAAGKSIVPGIDVSYWDGYSGSTTKINWSSVANDGITFAFVRLGYTGLSTGSKNLDPVYDDNMKKASAAGIKVGVYYFSQAITVDEAKAEAKYVLDNLGSYNLDLPIVMDYEYGGGRLTSSTPNKATKTEICNAFCKVIEDAGYTACVYADRNMLTDSLNHSEIDNNYHIWMAHWTTGASIYEGPYTFWQSCGDSEDSPHATVSGISGNVDLDWWYCDSDTVFSKSNVKSGPDIEKINGTWTYTVDGVPDYTYTGLAKNSNGWYYIKDGVLDRTYTGFAKNENGSWYMTNGKLTRKDNSVLKDTKGTIGAKNEWYYVVGSKVQ